LDDLSGYGNGERDRSKIPGEPCEDALLEPDPEKLFRRVLVAETAIFQRLQGFASSPENLQLKAMDGMLSRLRRLVAKTSMLPDGEEKVTIG
jgi:hypothetical protein